MAYEIALPPLLANIHNIFHVSQLRKYVPDPSHILESDSIQVKSGVPKWVENNCVRFLHQDVSWQEFQEELFSRGLSGIKGNYMGDDCVLLTPENEEGPKKMVDENRGVLENLFKEIVEWSDEIIPRHKQVWFRCWGLPLSLWNKDTFKNVVATQATKVIFVDEATLSLENTKFARFKARVSITCDTNF